MPTINREPMAFVDHFWLRLDRPYNRMTINSVFILADKLTLEQLQKTVETRWIAVYERFRQRPVRYSTGAYWETDTHFEPSNHFRRIGLPGAQGKEELEEFVSNLVSTPMDPTKPLWDFNLVEDYQGGSAFIMRVHHCYADGMAMIYLLLSMADKSPDAPVATLSSRAPQALPNAGDATSGNSLSQWLQPVSAAVSHTVNAGRDWLQERADLVRHPFGTLNYIREGLDSAASYARQGLGFASEAAGLLLMADEPRTRFKNKLGVAKRVAWIEPLPLNQVKTVSKALDCTMNDVLLSSVAGALRSYLVDRGDPVDRQLALRAVVPVNLRPPEQAKNLGNRFGLVLLMLPIGIEHPLERLQEVHQRMEALRTSSQALITFGLMEAMGFGPNVAQASAMNMLSKKATAVMTNVPGPAQPLYFASRKIAEMMFWVPQSGSVGMGVSIISYNDRVHFGLVTDRKLVQNPQIIIDQFGREFEKLLLMTLMGPWGGQGIANRATKPRASA